MNKRVFPLIFLSFLLLLSCDIDDKEMVQLAPFSGDLCEIIAPTPDSLRFEAIYDKPVILQPENSVFYSSEWVEIKWSLPGDLWNTEIQIIQSDVPYDCVDYEKFHQLNNQLSFGYGNQFVHYFTTTEHFSPVRDSIYVSYRARATDVEMVKNYSKWTDVRSFTVAPLSDLKKHTVTVSYSLDFITQEVNHFYYSGVEKVSNYRLLELADDHNIEYDKIRLVRIVNFESNFKTLREDGQIPFSRLIIGFNEDVDPEDYVYPFKAIGDVYPGSYEENPVLGSLGDNLSQNLFSDLKNYDLKVAYALEDVVGSQHQINLELTFEIYIDN